MEQITMLDEMLNAYCQKFESVPFEKMGEWYEYMKKNKLLATLTKEDVEIIRKAYNDDNYKCRCACVQRTFDFYRNSGFTFAKTMEVRNRLTA